MISLKRSAVTTLFGVATFILAGCGGDTPSGSSSSPSTVSTASTVVTSPAGPNCVFNALTATCKNIIGEVPYVLYSSRSDGTTDAAVNTDIVAVLSEPLDPASVNEASVTVVSDDNIVVPGKVEYDATRPALLFHQSQDLVGGHRYTATVASTIRDASGNQMGRSYSWSFSVNAQRVDTAQQRSIQQILDKAAYTYQIPGSIIAVRDDQGKTWTTTNGFADLINRMPIKSNMFFRIGSNTKTYVATLILQLVDAGKIGLDDPINKYLSAEMAAYMPAYDGNKITVRNLLQHTSGINNFTTDQTWGNAFISDPWKQYFPQELLLIANSHATDPGAPQYNNFFYSNTNYVLLGLMIKKVSNMTYEDAVANGITIPQGLTGTLVPRTGDATMQVPFSHGYWEDTETSILHDVTIKDPSTVWSSGNIVSTISDLARWGELLGQGTLLSSATQAQRLQYVPMSDHLAYGLGIVKDTGANLIGHQGGMIGYTSQTYYVPDKGYTLAFFYNRTLALHDYSDVMTYDAIKVLWPTRGSVMAQSTVQTQPAVKFPLNSNPKWRPGFLTEY
jgi:D-alanyl-D-alanine carboxypeptidase